MTACCRSSLVSDSWLGRGSPNQARCRTPKGTAEGRALLGHQYRLENGADRNI